MQNSVDPFIVIQLHCQMVYYTEILNEVQILILSETTFYYCLPTN